MALLGVNIDHVATVREARKTNEPDPVWAASLAELGGADGITLINAIQAMEVDVAKLHAAGLWATLQQDR